MIIREEPPSSTQGVPNRRPTVLRSSNGGGSLAGVWNSSISFTTATITTHTHAHTGNGNSGVGADISMCLPLSVPPALSVPPPQSLVRPRPLSLVRPRPLPPARSPPMFLARPPPLSPTRPRPLSLARPSPLSSTRPRALPLVRPPSLSLVRPQPRSLVRPPQSLVRPRRPSLARPPQYAPPYTERADNAHIGSNSFPLSSIGGDGNWDEIGTSARTSEEQRHREQVNVVSLATSVAPPPFYFPSSPPVFDNRLYVPDTLNGTYDHDFQYAMQLQMEEIQGREDEQMPMVDIVDPPTSTPRYNPHGTGMMSNVVAGPSSRPLTTSRMTRTAVATRTATVLDLTCECIGCFDSFKSFEGLQSSCGHYFCLPCVRNMVTASVSNESLFPPKCCKQPLMATFAEQMAGGGTSLVGNNGKDKNKDEDKDKGFMQIKWLGLILDDSVLKEKMERRWHEWGVKGGERVYCSNASCAIFLGSATEFDTGEPGDEESYLSHPASANTTRRGKSSQTNLRLFHGKKSGSSSTRALPIARCAACATSTCVSCKQRAHTGQTCTDSGDALFWNTVKVKRWRKCPACGAVIERNGGCSHMVCRCGNSFTYKA